MSTFVDSPLKIELIGTGEQVGTWGDTTNTNLKALQAAITGSATLDFSSGDVTLTLPNSNSPQDARNLRLVCTGASAPRNLIFGTGAQISKLYLIQNDTTFAITVKNSTGTGTVVAANAKKFVFNDGTNVIEALTTEIIDLASDVTGTLPIANGGTGGTATPTDGGVAYGNGTAYAFSTAGTSGYALISQGAGSAPTWQQVTNSNAASTIVARDASGAFSAGTITASLSGSSTSCSGNAATATTLATARNINGTSFDGSASITVPVNTSQKSDNVAYQIPFVTSVTPGNQSLYTDSAASFTYNPATDTLTVGTLSGSFSGNASTATTLQTARTINGTSFNGSASINTETYVTGVSGNINYSIMLMPSFAGVTGTYQAHAASAGPRYNPVSGALTATSFVGNASSATALSTASGFAPSYSARAWVNFDGTTAGVNPASMSIRGSGNVSSVTRTATGKFRINFSTAMPSNDYAIVGTHGNSTNAGGLSAVSTSTSYAEIETRFGNALDNPAYVSVVVFN